MKKHPEELYQSKQSKSPGVKSARTAKTVVIERYEMLLSEWHLFRLCARLSHQRSREH